MGRRDSSHFKVALVSSLRKKNLVSPPSIFGDLWEFGMGVVVSCRLLPGEIRRIDSRFFGCGGGPCFLQAVVRIREASESDGDFFCIPCIFSPPAAAPL